MGTKRQCKFDVEFGNVVLKLTEREIEFLKAVAEGGVRPPNSIGGPQFRLATYLRHKLGIDSLPTAPYCRVAFGAGLVRLIPAGCVKGAE